MDGLVAGDALGEADGLNSGDGIAGLSDTTGTLGLALGVGVVFLQPPKIVAINRNIAIIDVIFFIT